MFSSNLSQLTYSLPIVAKDNFQQNKTIWSDVKVLKKRLEPS